ncbi:MAG: hypothetical protein F6K54_09005 [Okeania sp. SIO3B5]|uniref:hypothetical protein n=1 Tax=Okeania sp. SIO3B5 TaxID=2607811 RepID=UPI0014015509|nr:hypothetical protein [Okeania sp. SIO3B5]NEO53206.1 hypothetical protein [Okeania sp. SIO3B5]
MDTSQTTSKLSTLNKTDIAVQGKVKTNQKLIPFLHEVALNIKMRIVSLIKFKQQLLKILLQNKNDIKALKFKKRNAFLRLNFFLLPSAIPV